MKIRNKFFKIQWIIRRFYVLWGVRIQREKRLRALVR